MNQTTAIKAVERRGVMLITLELAEKVRVKRAKKQQTKKAVAELLGIKPQTYTKIENGDYDAPKRIYQVVMNWLVEDC